MIWNCDGKIEIIEFEYSTLSQEHWCCINGYVYAWETSIEAIGTWDWVTVGYTRKLAGWVEYDMEL